MSDTPRRMERALLPPLLARLAAAALWAGVCLLAAAGMFEAFGWAPSVVVHACAVVVGAWLCTGGTDAVLHVGAMRGSQAARVVALAAAAATAAVHAGAGAVMASTCAIMAACAGVLYQVRAAREQSSVDVDARGPARLLSGVCIAAAVLLVSTVPGSSVAWTVGVLLEGVLLAGVALLPLTIPGAEAALFHRAQVAREVRQVRDDVLASGQEREERVNEIVDDANRRVDRLAAHLVTYMACFFGGIPVLTIAVLQLLGSGRTWGPAAALATATASALLYAVLIRRIRGQAILADETEDLYRP